MGQGGSGQGLDGYLRLGQGHGLFDLAGPSFEDMEILEFRPDPAVLVAGGLQLGVQSVVVPVTGLAQIEDLFEVFWRDLVVLGNPVCQLGPRCRGRVAFGLDVSGAVRHGLDQLRIDLVAVDPISSDIEERTDLHMSYASYGHGGI